MKTKHFWKLEYTITMLVVFSVILLMLPTSIQSTFQADLIKKWNNCYGKLSYMKDVMSKHEQENMLAQLKRTQDKSEREKIITMIIKPYLRLSEHSYLKHYHPRYMDGSKIKKGDKYEFTDFYSTDSNIIVGIKDINDEDSSSAMFMMMFDVNGILPPNIWGKDIFGAKIFDDRVEPLGKFLPVEALVADCSAKGSGVSCSYYYKIGGSFTD